MQTAAMFDRFFFPELSFRSLNKGNFVEKSSVVLVQSLLKDACSFRIMWIVFQNIV